jgi:allophanate hydrolase subunit 2
MAQMRFQASCPMMFSVAGASSEIRVDDELAGYGGVFCADVGSEVSIATPLSGVRTYLSARFTDLPSCSVRIQAGDAIGVERSAERARSLKLAESEIPREPALRVLPGPQAGSFSMPALEQATFSVSPKSNRVGIRMQEAAFPHRIELPSEPAGFGAIQVTPDGTPIILGPDGPTIGGYPKIAYVISADLDKLGQLRPGQEVAFRIVEMDEARRAARER